MDNLRTENGNLIVEQLEEQKQKRGNIPGINLPTTANSFVKMKVLADSEKFKQGQIVYVSGKMLATIRANQYNFLKQNCIVLRDEDVVMVEKK